MVDHEAEHGRCPFFGWEGWGEPLLADGFISGCRAWESECGVRKSGVLDVEPPGNVVADVVGVLVGFELGKVDWWWDWREGVACFDGEAFGLESICVAVDDEYLYIV